MDKHQPVLLNETIAGLNIQKQGCYVDATFGRGGHSRVILQHLGDQGRLLGLDRDPAAQKVAEQLVKEDKRFSFEACAFSRLQTVLESRGWFGQINGILFDLGVSSPQLDDPERGFSFMREGPLDMRMDPEQGISAAEWLQRATESEIRDVLWRYGEERQAKSIARAIVQARQNTLLTTTKELSEIVATVVRRRAEGKHPATRTFLALRLYINQELEELRQVLPQAFASLAPGGRLAVISFHSLEDRITKRFMKGLCVRAPKLQAHLAGELTSTVDARLIGKAVRATEEELKENVRARSAVLRVLEKRDTE